MEHGTLSGDRKTAYLHGKRLGPDVLAMVKRNPLGTLIHYRGRSYKFMRCSAPDCEREYWRIYADHTSHRTVSVNPQQVYCSNACAVEGRRVKRNARQRRYYVKLAQIIAKRRRRR